MKHYFFFLILALTIGITSCKDDPATPATTGTISGIVKNDTGAIVAGAIVTTTPPTSSVTSDANGAYNILDVVPSTYTVTAAKAGMGNGSTSITVTAGKNTTADIIIGTEPPNKAPNSPFNPTPVDAELVAFTTSVNLSWQCSDPDNDPLTYDVYLGTVSTLSSANKIAENLTMPNYAKNNLDTGVTYYWQVIARDKHGKTQSGPVWQFRILSQNYALEFNAQNTFVNIDDAADLRLSGGDFTIEVWMYFNNEIGTWRTILAKDDTDDSTDYALIVDRAQRKFRFQTRNFNTVLFSQTSVKAKTWYHIAIVQNISSNTVEMYVNGTVEATSVVNGSISENRSPLRIGARVNNASGYQPASVMDGVIDEVRIWNVARTLSEIITNKGKQLHGNENGLVAFWNFSEGNGEQAKDVTGKKHDGVLMNMPKWVVSLAPIK